MSAQIQIFDTSIQCTGEWTVRHISELSQGIDSLSIPAGDGVVVDGQHIKSMDTNGALILCQIIANLKAKGKTISLNSFSAHHQALLTLVEAGHTCGKAHVLTNKTTVRYNLGLEFTAKLKQCIKFIQFVGHTSLDTFNLLKHPKRFPFGELMDVLRDVGNYAMPIVGLLSFLIGVVLAYQIGLQLEYYGANVFIVQLTGMAMLREFSPLITAVIAAGRTSSALTAYLGMMNINEEIDALKTMGISPYERLIVVRMVGVFIALPLLTYWADLFGILGSMIMSNAILGVDYVEFMTRLKAEVRLSDYLLGMSKAPIFAILIASVGCFQGLEVQKSSESIGKNTTQSVVQAIFLIIVADALLSVLFSWLGL